MVSASVNMPIENTIGCRAGKRKGPTRYRCDREIDKGDANVLSAGVDVTLLVSDVMRHVPVSDGSGVPEEQLAYDEMIKFDAGSAL